MQLPINYEKSHWTVRKEAREEYIKQQGGKCWYCKKELSGNPSEEVVNKPITRRLFPPNFFKYPVHLHHCHVTGMSIGAVHNKCNAVLWQYHGE